MRRTGFSLTELLVALALCAALAALGASGLRKYRATMALRTATSQTLAALHLARRMALAQGRSVTVCPSADGRVCAFGARQWIMFANLPGGAESRLDGEESVLRRWQVPAGVLVGGSRGYAAFQPVPGAASTATFEFRHPALPGEVRRIVVSQTGRPRLGG